ncbi:MAG: DegV family protein [Candidatus Coproplasma sp.]
MKKFVILTDSCSDLNKELRTKYDVEYMPMRLIYDGNDIPASLDWEYIPVKEFYDKMRKGVRFTTAQVNSSEYKEAFEKYVSDGLDVLSISCSSALSGSFKASTVARDEVLAAHPEAKIICIDGLNACMGLGFLSIVASELRAEGKTIEETASFIEENKLKVHQYATADDLVYLKRAGRVSATSAVFGGMLKIKPIIISDANGQNVAAEKVKGRAAATKRLTQLFTQEYRAFPYQKVAVLHADSPEEGEQFRQQIVSLLPDKNIEVYFDYIGPIIGASVGPGTLAVYFFGDEVTYKA